MSDDLALALFGVIVLLAAVATAQLPDPGDPAVVQLPAGFGGFLGASVGKLAGRDQDTVVRMAFEGGFYGTGFALLLYAGTFVA